MAGPRGKMDWSETVSVLGFKTCPVAHEQGDYITLGAGKRPHEEGEGGYIATPSNSDDAFLRRNMGYSDNIDRADRLYDEETSV